MKSCERQTGVYRRYLSLLEISVKFRKKESSLNKKK